MLNWDVDEVLYAFNKEAINTGSLELLPYSTVILK